MLLWAEIRPQLRVDLEQVRRIDVTLQNMAAAIEVDDTCAFQEAAQTLQGLDVSALR
ncbi:hypothetical protein [Variovorax sp. GT1P44]|uniref:hypothetical protein n=1 Tax=Variovorax sp. GT1P44 TaxID=3443742 RepID=UPI003F47324D